MDPKRLYHCDVCLSDCTTRIRILCAICVDYDLCVPCFALGASSGDHMPWHDYHVVEQNTYPIFDGDWGADEELLLIQGCETFGLGNWQDIADHIGNRSPQEVADHYFAVYLNPESYPLPHVEKDFSSVLPPQFLRARAERLKARRALPLPPPKQKPVGSVPLCHEIQGYMPGRLEFDCEAENDAEVVIKDMLFDPQDLADDIELKLTVLDIYNSRLTTRAERKRLLLRNGLLDYRKNILGDKRRQKDEKELLRRVAAFMRVLSPSDYATFAHDVLLELRCRTRIAQLQQWRVAGITTIEDGNRFEKDRQIRQAHYVRIGQNSSGNGRHAQSDIAVQDGYRKSYTSSANGVLGGNLRAPLDIAHACDYELLLAEEKQLCANLRIMPKPYLAIKLQLLKEAIRNNGQLKKKDARQALKIDVNKASKIYEFFVLMGWCSQG